MKSVDWQFLIAADLFLSGLSAGLWFTSSLAFLRGREAIARMGAWLVPVPVLAGIACLAFDLGRPFRAYQLYLHFRWESPMWIGSWLLLVFTVLSLLNLWAWRDARLERCRAPLARLALPLAIALAGYTGVLLGAVAARPFWNSALVAPLFVLSSFSAGCAALILAVRRNVEFLHRLNGSLLRLQALAIVLVVMHGRLSLAPVRNAMNLVLGGPYTLLFWVFFAGCGVLLPLALERTRSRRAGSVLTIPGALLLRSIVLLAGQASAIAGEG